MMKSKTNVFKCLVFILVASLLLTACSFGVTISLRAPQIFNNPASQNISWSPNEKANGYEVYINNNLVGEIEKDDNISTYTFSYAEYTIEDGSYNIKVKAKGDGVDYKDSRFSNIITIYIGENQTGGVDTSNLEMVKDSEYSPENIDYMSESLSITWNPVEKENTSLEKYIVRIFCNNYTDENDNRDKVRSFYVTQNYFTITDYLKGHEILAISIGSKFENDDNIYLSDTVYFNPLNENIYENTKYGMSGSDDFYQVYVFDGGVYDFYIEDYEELQNLYYYTYISRATNVEFAVSNSFYSSHYDDYFSTDIFIYTYNNKQYELYENQKYITGISTTYSQWAYYETYDFSSIPYLRKGVTTSLGQVFNLITGYTYLEPTLNYSDGEYTGLSSPILSQVSMEEPYYNSIACAEYPVRSNEYDDFESDDNVLSTYCDTSEELYWAVENNVTPLFKDTTSRAYLIYKEAKNVLKDIIKEGMTDYEKALSIFDWIATTTCYDNDGYSKGASTDNSCYYLEGVFLDNNHLAVCDGFSKAYALLCNMEDIDCLRVMGRASGGGHAWNKVLIDNNWYVVDITWTEVKQNQITQEGDEIKYLVDDVTINHETKYYRYPEMLQKEEYNCHSYFLISDTMIASTHTPFPQRHKIRNSVIPADNIYGYYTKPTFNFNGKDYSRVVDSNDDMSALLDYVYQNNIENFETLIEYNYFNSFSSLSSLVQTARGDDLFMGVSFGGWLLKVSNNINNLTQILDENGQPTTVLVDGVECEYELPVVQNIQSIVYAVNEYTAARGYLIYFSCETNIIDVTTENLNEETNRYNKFIDYIVANSLEYSGDISFEDAFLADVLQLDLETCSQENIINAIILKLEASLNEGLAEKLYNVTLEFKQVEDVSSQVYNGSEFVVKEYESYQYAIEIHFNGL